MVTGAELINTLRVLGFYDFLLPWVFTFAVVFGLLTVAKLFGDYTQKISAAVALVVAFFVTAYAGPQMALFFANIFGGMTIVLAGILVIVLLVVMVGYTKEEAFKKNYILIALIIIGIILFIVSTGAASGIGYWALLSPDLIALVIVLIVIVAAVYMIVQAPSAPSEKGGGPPPKKEG